MVVIEEFASAEEQLDKIQAWLDSMRETVQSESVSYGELVQIEEIYSATL